MNLLCKVTCMARRSKPSARPACALGYVRVSTLEQAESGAGLAAQRSTIDLAAQAAGLTVLDVMADEAVSGKIAPTKRPGLAAALALLAAGDACALIVSKVDRLGRKTSDVLALADLADREGWRLIAPDLGLDTATPTGRLVLTMLAACAQFERDRIAERTREGLAEKRAMGVRLGRPVVLAAIVRARIAAERADGATLTAIADGLNADGTPTARGGRWHASTVRSVLASLALDLANPDRLANDALVLADDAPAA